MVSSAMYIAVLFLPSAFAMMLQGEAKPFALTVKGTKEEAKPFALAVKGTKIADDAKPFGLAVKGVAIKGVAVKGVAVYTGEQAVEAMATVFDRSEEVHAASLEEIANKLTLAQATQVIDQSQWSNDTTLKQVIGLVSGGKKLRADGFGGLDGARRLLNDMIHESMTKYDAEIAKCTDYYAKQCALMETARGAISAANYIAATSRALILDGQDNINKCQFSIPETKQELKNHNQKCKSELKKMNARLKIIMGDIEVMTMILEMSDCDKKLLQIEKLTMLRCENKCSHKEYVTFNHKGLEDEIQKVTPSSKDLIASTFEDLFNGDDEAEDVAFVQVAGSLYRSIVKMDADPKKTKKTKDVTPKKTKFNNPPLPRTVVPMNPCTDPNAGGPSESDKAAAKCTLKKSPQCYKLQGRFLQIQAEIADSRDELMDQISKLENSCEETKKTLEASIQADADLLSSSQTKLAAATEKEAAAGEKGRQVAKENQQYNDDLVKQMKTCSTNYINFETELCALKKIRGDLFKKMKPGDPKAGFFQDCAVAKWTPEECTKKCAGGEQKLTRKVLSHPERGSKCLPLAAQRKCNRQPCPVNCKLAQWSGWGKCSSKCGGGIQARVRDVKQAMKYGGVPCGETTESRQCAVQACEKDCVLHEWTKWTGCTKDCDGGSAKRQRFIKEPSEGSGACAGVWEKRRLEYKNCNVKRCKVADPTKVMKCNKTMDVVILLDGTPRSKEKGWAAEQKAANQLIDAWSGPGYTAKPSFSILHYTGPRTWSGVSKCTGQSTKKVDMVKTCKIKIAQHFSDDAKKTKATVNSLKFEPGSKLLSLALMTVESELALGNKNSPTIVVVFVDGQPLSHRKTLLTSQTIRKKARLLWVAITKAKPLANIKAWASRRWEENLVTVSSAEELALPETGTHIIANICPKETPKLKLKKKKGL